MLSEDIVGKLDELTELADSAKIAIALGEAYNPKGLSFLGPHNELRNALFHTMEMIKTREENAKCQSEFRAAKSHFRRAGCDAYELLCVNCIQYIRDLLIEYDTEDINIAIPGYYTEIRKTANEVGREVAKIKLDKDLTKQNGEDLFRYFYNQAEKIIGYVELIDEYIPNIIEIQKKKEVLRVKNKRKEQRYIFLQIITGIVIASVFFILGFFVS